MMAGTAPLPPLTLQATCPTCGCSGTFTSLGTQVWPAPVAQKLGMPERIGLWLCPHCHTTLTDMSFSKGTGPLPPAP